MDFPCEITHAFPSRKTNAFLVHVRTFLPVEPLVYRFNLIGKEGLLGSLISLIYTRQIRSVEADEPSKNKSIVEILWLWNLWHACPEKWGQNVALGGETICLLLRHGMKSRKVSGYPQNLSLPLVDTGSKHTSRCT